MKKKKLRFGKGFRVVRGNRASQAAEMVLAPGDSEGGSDKRTLNFYVPPAYKTNGDPLPRGRK